MAINGTLVLKDTQGKLLTTQLDVSVPAGFNGGTPCVQDCRLTITSAGTNLWKLGGLSYDLHGRLAVTSTGPPVDWSAGIPLDDRGRVYIENDFVVYYNSNGIPITYSGAVAMGVSFAPEDIFKNEEQGLWLDPSDFSTMFQDSNGTVPVTAPGQFVGKILDKSGNANHVFATTARRPTLQIDEFGLYYLNFGGTDDGMQTEGNIDLTATDKLTFWIGLRKAVARVLH